MHKIILFHWTMFDSSKSTTLSPSKMSLPSDLMVHAIPSCFSASVIVKSTMLSQSKKSLRRSRTNASITLIAMTGPATEALERSLKRRRISDADEEETKSYTTSPLSLRKSSTMNKDSKSPLFSFDNAFNTISSVEDENYCDFPAIAWDFDDEDDTDKIDSEDYKQKQ